MLRFLSVAFSLLFSTSAFAQVTLSYLGTVDVSSTSNNVNPQFIGSNPSAVAWDGTNVWVAGYNSSGVTANVAIAQVATALTTPTFGTAFGVVSSPNLRGITGLALNGNNLAASFDSGVGSGDAVRLFNATSGAQTWRIGDAGAGNDSTRRGNGVAFDPGYIAGGSPVLSVSYLSIGSGRRHRLDTAAGTYLNGQNAGAIINFSPTSTVWRDLTFDPTTGDLYTRESNRIGKAVRNADNTFVSATSTAIGGLTSIGTVDNENIEFVNSSLFGKFLIVNDRPATSTDIMSNVVKAFDLNGNALSITYNGFDPTLVSGNRAFDFSFDAASQTLAISDFTNRNVYIFAIAAVPEPTSILMISTVGLGIGGYVYRQRQKRKKFQQSRI